MSSPSSTRIQDGRNSRINVVPLSEASEVDIHASRVRASSEDEDHPTPTEQELGTLRRVSDSIPMVIWLLCVVEFSERASYYGAKGVFANFMMYPLPKGGNGAGAPPAGTQATAGALGKGLQFSNAFVLLFTFLAYVVPIFGAWLADTKLGRFKAILIGVFICFISHIIMVFGGLPSVLQSGHAVGPFIVSLLVLAFGAGIFKPNVAPLLIDQYRHQRPYTKVLESGEKVVVDPEATIQRLMLIFYALVNVGAFYALACTYAEKRIGYWLAFLLPTIVFMLLPLVLAFLYKRLAKTPPRGSELTQFSKVLALALKENKGIFWRKGFWGKAKPSTLAEKGVTSFRGKPVDWSDTFVDDVARTVSACGIFLYFPIWTLNDGGIGSVGSAQASTMVTNGAPNDLLGSFNPLTIIVTIPILSHIVYPYLRKHKINFGRITRITFGFVLATISGIFGTVVQYYIYKTNPCGYQALSCAENGIVSPISVWWQIPMVSLGAISECFCNVTAYEIAYARSPKHMKSLVMALFLFATALSSALGEIITPAITDPYLIWIWAAPAIALAVQTVLFWFKYKHLNHDEFMIYGDDDSVDDASYVSTEKDKKELN